MCEGGTASLLLLRILLPLVPIVSTDQDEAARTCRMLETQVSSGSCLSLKLVGKEGIFFSGLSTLSVFGNGRLSKSRKKWCTNGQSRNFKMFFKLPQKETGSKAASAPSVKGGDQKKKNASSGNRLLIGILIKQTRLGKK